ncbi:MAG: hypothetical protein WBA02_10675 [Jannaschia helgolandensis]|uniref:Uncharacterized protein n=1 Tax=Jannaschia helgolandensis TaxID=188906 RepID=A0A1H7PK69_9RHOB|nr:hypothetical protein [Jannaschia helgolandensis]SEL35878.1 hypothetical protein SAMN04488526_2563 [Jannaschia helgolandensis]
MREEDEMMKFVAYRAELKKALERVGEQMDYIEASGIVEHGGDEPRKRIGLSLPYSVLHMARFLAVMEAELMPASLTLWNNAETSGRRNAALHARLERQARRYLETRIENLLFDELNRLYARVVGDNSGKKDASGSS